MKFEVIILWLASLIIFNSCKFEEQNNEPKQIQRQQNVIPPKQEQTHQTIQKQDNIDPKVSSAIIAVIEENLAATEAKDKERVINTISTESPQLRSTMQGMEYVFANFDMNFELERVEVIEVNGDNAKVYYMQTTQAIRGEGFAPTRATGIHHMKKENGQWKIFKTDYLSNEPIKN